MRKDQMIRNYEISVWTLQDGFIAVLKQPNLNHKGQVQDAIEKINIDGTQELTFTIPMYLNKPDGSGNSNKIENPIWYNTKNGNLMVNMRKIKVILNKNTEAEAVHEYIINKINERHEKGELYCDVECEGLAFNELGKIGYKIVLNQDDFLYDYEDWFKNSMSTPEPRETIQYWLKKLSVDSFPEDTSKILPNKWYYEIQMSWNASGSIVGRAGNKIYEEEYTASWRLNENNEVMPAEFSTLKEKERPIDISESNMYNITQKLAEIFGVFCKYEYGYDENYHIIYRKIIYYNNFIEEEKGHMDISYPYHSSKITRESDGTDLVTKMYIRIQDSEDELLNIMDADPNKSKEDYILNFDYLYGLDIISKEQYKGIEEFENKMFNINSQLKDLSTEMDIINNQILEEETNKAVAEKAKIEAENQFNNANDHWTTLGGDWQNNETGIIAVQGYNSKVLIILEDQKGGKYVDIPFLGVIPDSIRLYSGILNYTNDLPFDNCIMIENYSTEFDEYGNLIKITNLPINLSTSTLFLSCKYVPKNYWEKVRNYWIIAKTRYNSDFDEAQLKLDELNNRLMELDPEYKLLLDQKKELISKFEQMMGPALREGYWQPDEYFDYNSNYTVDFNGLNEGKKNEVQYYWDNEIHKGEDKITFMQGNDERQYLMIKLNSNNFNYIKENYNNLSFIYYDQAITSLTSSVSEADKSNLFHSIHLNGGCQLGFILNNEQITPVLIVTESKLFTLNQLKFFRNQWSYYLSKIGIITYEVEDGKIITTIDDNAIVVNASDYIFGNNNEDDPLLSINNVSLVLPRILIESSFLNTSSSELLIKLNNEKVLTEYEDYYITKDYNKTYITIKPDVFFKLGNINPSLFLSYSLSTTSIAVYLDAIQIAKENAYPKVSYTVDLTIYDPSIVYDIYNKLSRIVHINDTDLKFENVQGYISEVESDLDHPWNDKIEIKNYKTKFEDLFSTIMASTTDIQKNGYRYSIAANGFRPDGTLSEEVIETSLNNNPSIFNNFLNSNFDSINIINQKLESIFNEAGALLSTAGNSLTNMQSLSVSNANILSGLYAGIQEGFANGINYMNDYTFATGDKINVSAVRINKDEGIYIGSNKKIILSATNAIKNAEGNYIGDPEIEQSGANVELSPQRLLMGVSNLTSGANGVVDITSDQIILAVGTNAQALQEDASKEITTQANLSGVQIKNNYIGLATGTGNNRSIVSIKPTDITLGVATINKTGSYIKIAQDKLELGSAADLYINTNNFKLQTNYDSNNSIGSTIFAIGSNLQNITASTDINTLTKNSSINFLINQSGTFVNGNFTVTGTAQNGYYPFFKITNDTMGIFRSSTATTNLSSQNVEKLLYFENGNLHVKGDIIASSFQLNGSTAQANFDQAVLNSSLATQVSNITATNIVVSYYADKNSKTQTELNQLSASQWKNSVDAAVGSMEKPYYLYTRSVTTYNGGNTSTAYSISYVGQDGESGADGESATYITTIISLYYLTSNNQSPAKPQSEITSNSTEAEIWTTVIPTYRDNYTYYRCTQYKWSDSTNENPHFTWSDVYRDPGLTAMYQYMTEASATAASAATAIAPITAYGLVGRNQSVAGSTSGGIYYDDNGYPTWNNNSYGLILGNSTSESMLIGSNSGITIVADAQDETKGEAISLTNGGIALHGGSINLTTTSDTITNVISLSDTGINLASTAEINMETGGKFNVSADSGSISLGDYFTIDSNGNLRCKNITCDSINGTIASNSTTEDIGEGETTIYNNGYQIWFSGNSQTVTGKLMNITFTANLKLEHAIQSNTNLNIKLGFADNSTYWFFIDSISFSIGGNSYSASLDENFPSGGTKVGQGYTSVFFTINSGGGIAANSNGYFCSIVLQLHDTGLGPYTLNNTFYPNQSYIQIV